MEIELSTMWEMTKDAKDVDALGVLKEAEKNSARQRIVNALFKELSLDSVLDIDTSNRIFELLYALGAIDIEEIEGGGEKIHLFLAVTNPNDLTLIDIENIKGSELVKATTQDGVPLNAITIDICEMDGFDFPTVKLEFPIRSVDIKRKDVE